MEPGSLQSALDRTERLTRRASSSFYWAMRLMPRPRRQAMFAIYAFCRIVDDIADDGSRPAAERMADLERWRTRIEALYSGAPDHFVTRALAPAVERHDLSRRDFLAVIDGMEMDAAGPVVAPSMERLDFYCDCVASAVGRLSVKVFGERGGAGRAVAHHQGRALQLANILRDVAEDAAIGRLYLPREMLERHGIDWSDPARVMAQPGFPALWRELAGVAAHHFDETRRLLSACSADMRPARIMMEVYERNFRRMQALTDAELADPAVPKRLVGKFEKLVISFATWLRGR